MIWRVRSCCSYRVVRSRVLVVSTPLLGMTIPPLTWCFV